MYAKCQEQTYALHQYAALFDHLVGAARGRYGDVERLERLQFRQVRCMRYTTVSPDERVHPLVRTHKQLHRVLSEIEAYLF
jgi:hypothetical protein